MQATARDASGPPRCPVAPVQAAERVEAIDVLRAFALFGVLMVNLLTEFRVSLFQYLEVFHTHAGRANEAVDLACGLVLESKSFAVFSLLFGAGLAVQSERVTARGGTFGRFAARRLAGLLVLGLVHLILVWNGDILTEYAVAGACVVPLVRRSPRVLLAAALVVLAVHAWPLHLPDDLPHGPALARHVAAATAAYGRGGYVDALRFRQYETLRFILPLLVMAFPRTVGMMLLGAWAWRRGVFRTPSAHRGLLRSSALVGLAAGGAATGAQAWTALHGRSLGDLSAPLAAMGTVGLALGYAASALLLLQRPPWARRLARLAPMGRMALSNYLGQSVVLGLVFYGYGLGLFGRLGSAVAALIGLALYAAQALISAWWLARHRFGPVEWLWRSWTYGAVQPLRR